MLRMSFNEPTIIRIGSWLSEWFYRCYFNNAQFLWDSFYVLLFRVAAKVMVIVREKKRLSDPKRFSTFVVAIYRIDINNYCLKGSFTSAVGIWRISIRGDVIKVYTVHLSSSSFVFSVPLTTLPPFLAYHLLFYPFYDSNSSILFNWNQYQWREVAIPSRSSRGWKSKKSPLHETHKSYLLPNKNRWKTSKPKYTYIDYTHFVLFSANDCKSKMYCNFFSLCVRFSLDVFTLHTYCFRFDRFTKSFDT